MRRTSCCQMIQKRPSKVQALNEINIFFFSESITETKLDGEFGWVKKDNDTTVQPFFMIFGRFLAKTDHSAWLHIVYGVSKLSQTQVSCVWKSATNIRALKVELPTRYNVHRKDTYIPSLYDFGLAQTLSCTNQT